MSESHVTVIESDRYRQEEQALVADPIITRMAGDVIRVEGGLDLAIVAASRTDFTTVALRGYTSLGGDQHFSIGGPARAIQATLRKLKAAVEEVDGAQG